MQPLDEASLSWMMLPLHSASPYDPSLKGYRKAIVMFLWLAFVIIHNKYAVQGPNNPSLLDASSTGRIVQGIHRPRDIWPQKKHTGTFQEPRNRFQEIDSASLVACQAGMTTLFLLGSRATSKANTSKQIRLDCHSTIKRISPYCRLE